VAPEHVARVDVEDQSGSRRFVEREVEGVDAVERDGRHRLAVVLDGRRRAVADRRGVHRDRQPRRPAAGVVGSKGQVCGHRDRDRREQQDQRREQLDRPAPARRPPGR
jgi:hypothetical protein